MKNKIKRAADAHERAATGSGLLNGKILSKGAIFVISMMLLSFSVSAVEQVYETKNTTVIVDNTPPFIEAKWELPDADPLTSGIQIIGISGQNTTVVKCAIVCDKNSVDDIADVEAYVFYPNGTLKDHEYLTLAPMGGVCWSTIPSWDYIKFMWKYKQGVCNIYEGNLTMYGGDEITGDGKDPEGTYTVIIVVNDTNGTYGNMTNSFDYSYKNLPPFIEAKWELPDDDNYTDGTQVYPVPGDIKIVTKCVIACDPNGIIDIADVEAYVYYPNGILKEHEYLSVASANSICRQMIPPYDVDFWSKYERGICEVYEGNLTMEFWEQPGDYLVEVEVNDTVGNYSYMTNTFEYMACLAVDTDADLVNFGSLVPGSISQVTGDHNMLTLNAPTIRNLCNIPLNISIKGTPLSCTTPGTCNNSTIPVPTVGFDVGVYNLAIPGVYGALPLPIMPGPMNTNLENFQLNVPLGTLPGSYKGIVTVAGVQG